MERWEDIFEEDMILKWKLNIHTAYEWFFRFWDSETYLTCDDRGHQAKSIKRIGSLYGHCNQNSGQKQLASDMQMKKSGSSASSCVDKWNFAHKFVKAIY